MTTLYGKAGLLHLAACCPGFELLGHGESTKVCHTTCPAGEDKRFRMNVINEGGAYLWHCFNCGDSGHYRAKDSFAPITQPAEVSSTIYDSPILWRHLWDVAEQDVDKFSTAARLWLAQYEMLNPGLFREHDEGLMIPVFTAYGRQVGIQRRMFRGQRKYLTYIDKGHTYSVHGPCSPTLYIVEDLLSAIKLGHAGKRALCAMGTTLSTLPTGVEEYVIWMDDDEAGHRGALKLSKELGAISNNVTVMFNKQPKEISMDILKTMPGGKK